MGRGSGSGAWTEKQAAKRKTKDCGSASKNDGKGNKKKEMAQCQCYDCGKAIHENTKALNCERCDRNWKCSTCLGIDDRIYLELIEINSLHWFCENCEEAMLKPESLQSESKIMSMIGELMEQVNTLSKSLERKVDVATVLDLERKNDDSLGLHITGWRLKLTPLSIR